MSCNQIQETWIIHGLECGNLSFKDLPQPWQENIHVVRAAVRKNGLDIRYAPHFQNHEEIGLLAVQNNGVARMWLSEHLQHNPTIQEAAKNNLPKHLPVNLIENNYAFLKNNNRLSARVYFAKNEKSLITKRLKDVLENLNQLRFYNESIPVTLKSFADSFFLRDPAVSRFEGDLLIPYSPKFLTKSHTDQKCYAMFMEAMNPHAAKKYGGYCGLGIEQVNTDQAIATAFDLGIPFTRGNTCIEGGNCFLFMHKEEKRALIGEWSLYLTFCALKEQGFFENIEANTFQTPSFFAMRLARNLALYKINKKIDIERSKILKNIQQAHLKETQEIETTYIQKKLDIWKLHCNKLVTNPYEFSEHYYRDLDQITEEEQASLINIKNKYSTDAIIFSYDDKKRVNEKLMRLPISLQDQQNYWQEAQIIEAQLHFTQKMISQELNIPLEHLIFIPQTGFHIDMELFVTPDGIVGLHDDQETKNFLKEMQETEVLDENTLGFLEHYLDAATKRAEAFQSIQKQQQDVLKEHGIPFKILPAIFKIPEKSELNYCNGFFLKKGFLMKVEDPSESTPRLRITEEKFAFVSTAPSYAGEIQIHHKFLELFHSRFPHIEFHGVPNTSHFVASWDGGVHCFTRDWSHLPEYAQGMEE